jgi:hypothetical protein
LIPLLEDTRHRKAFITGLVLFCLPFFSAAQGLTPQQQQKVDSLIQWINRQAKEGKTPDPHYIDSVNKVIRDLNPQAVSEQKKTTADTVEITKQSIAGSSFTVPEGKRWTVRRVYVNDGGSYNILVTSVRFDKPLSAGEKLFAPTWTAEAELLSGNKATFTYIFRICEESLKQ